MPPCHVPHEGSLPVKCRKGVSCAHYYGRRQGKLERCPAARGQASSGLTTVGLVPVTPPGRHDAHLPLHAPPGALDARFCLSRPCQDCHKKRHPTKGWAALSNVLRRGQVQPRWSRPGSERLVARVRGLGRGERRWLTNTAPHSGLRVNRIPTQKMVDSCWN